MTKIGRNKPCPCGSGKKYKRCCGAFSKQNASHKPHYVKDNIQYIKETDIDKPLPRYVLWSTRRTTDMGVPSIMGITETVVAVGFFWWFSIHFNSYALLAFSAIAAPFVLLRSESSDALSLRWFKAWENRFWGPHLDYDHMTRRQKIRVWLRGGAAGTIGGLLTVIGSSSRYDHLQDATGFFVMGVASAWLGILIAVVLLAIFRGNLRAGGLRHAGMDATRIGVMFASTTAGIVGGIASGNPFPTLGAIISGSLLLRNNPVDFGIALTILMLAKTFTIGATILNVGPGFRTLPANFRRLVLCTSPANTPELMPNLTDDKSDFTFSNIWRKLRYGPDKPSEGISMGQVYGPLLVIFVPSWIYRFTLKSTAWFWWPAAIIGRQPLQSTHVEWFHEKIRNTLWARATIALSSIALVMFFLRNTWESMTGWRVPDNPFLTVFGYFFVIDWSGPPWQLLGLTAAVLSLVILFWTDWSFRKRTVALGTHDKRLLNQAEWEFTAIEVLARVRAVVLIIYWAAIGLHAGLYFNARSCWLKPVPEIMAFAERLYRDQTPHSVCQP